MAVPGFQDWDGKSNVEHPSADPFVLGCGGTQINEKNQDVAWKDGTPPEVV